jgi:hypothetical protein
LSPASFVCVPSTPLLNEEASESSVNYLQEVIDNEEHKEPNALTPRLTKEVSESLVSYVQEVVHDENTDEAITTSISVSPPHIEEVSESTFYYVQEWLHDENSDNTEAIPTVTMDSSTPTLIEEVSYYYEGNYDSIQTSSR